MAGWRRPRAPRGLLGMLALVALAEWALARDDLGCSNPEGINWRYRARLARHVAPDCAVLCLGDSQVKYGVDPVVVEAALGKKARNLALQAGPPSATYFQLRHALEGGARPEALVVDFSPHVLDWDLRYCAQLWPELADFRDCLDLGRATRDPAFVSSIALARVLTSVRDRIGLRDRLSGLLGIESRRDPSKGWVEDIGARSNSRLRPDASLLENIVAPNGWSCSPTNEGYVRRIFDLAASRGIRVFWLIPPFDPPATASRDGTGLDSAYSRFADGVLSKDPNLTVVDGRRLGYDRSMFADPIHLNPEGARALSGRLAEVLNRSDCPRWVELSAGHGRAVELTSRHAPRNSLPETGPGR